MTTRFYQHCLTLEFAVLLVSLVSAVSQEPLIVENSLYVILSLWLFSHFTIRTLKKKQREECELLEVEQLADEFQAQRYIIQLNELFSSGDYSFGEPFIISSLKRSHESRCLRPECFCRAAGLAKADHSYQYDKLLIIDTMHCIADKFPHSFDILLLVSYIKLNIHHKFVDTLWRLGKAGARSQEYSFVARALVGKYIINIRKFL